MITTLSEAEQAERAIAESLAADPPLTLAQWRDAWIGLRRINGRLLAEREEMLFLLREVEWADNSGDEYDARCPCCCGASPAPRKYGDRAPGEGHAADCRLDAFLRGSR